MGDSSQRHVELSVVAIVEEMGTDGLDWQLCYQSCVGRLKWIRSYIEDEFSAVGVKNRPMILYPITFVSEHFETRVELNVKFQDLVMEKGMRVYIGLNPVSVSEKYIEGLATIIRATLANDNTNDEDYSTAPDGVEECPCGTAFSGYAMMQSGR